MGVRLVSQVNNLQQNTNLAAASETVVAICGPVNLPLDNAPILLLWFIRLITGGSSTATSIRIRRGTTTAGVQVGQTVTQPTVASTGVRFGGMYVDSIASGSGLQYCLTVAFTGAAGAGTLSDVAMGVLVL